MDNSAANRILGIFNMQLPVVGSWGSKDYRPIEHGIEFKVSGYLYTGLIQVFYASNTDSFTVRRVNNNNFPMHEVSGVKQDILVDIIDELVEKDCCQEEYSSKMFLLYNWQ